MSLVLYERSVHSNYSSLQNVPRIVLEAKRHELGYLFMIANMRNLRIPNLKTGNGLGTAWSLFEFAVAKSLYLCPYLLSHCVSPIRIQIITYRLNSADMKLLCGLYLAGFLYILQTSRSLHGSSIIFNCKNILSIFASIGE